MELNSKSAKANAHHGTYKGEWERERERERAHTKTARYDNGNNIKWPAIVSAKINK